MAEDQVERLEKELNDELKDNLTAFKKTLDKLLEDIQKKKKEIVLQELKAKTELIELRKTADIEKQEAQKAKKLASTAKQEVEEIEKRLLENQNISKNEKEQLQGQLQTAIKEK